jgi:hypothetical protein
MNINNNIDTATKSTIPKNDANIVPKNLFIILYF